MSLALVKRTPAETSRERAGVEKPCYSSSPEIRAGEINILDQEKSLSVCFAYAIKEAL